MVDPELPFPDLDDLPWFVIEEVQGTFHNQSRQSMGVSKLNSRKVHQKRWAHVKVIHIILPFPGIQSYFARHLKCPHYHLTKEERDVWLRLQASAGMELKYYTSEVDVHESAFLYVCNHDSSSSLFDNINWDCVVESAQEHGKLDQHRGNYHVDVGHASDHNTCRTGSKFGISQPRLLEHTSDERYLDLFKAISNVIPDVSPTVMRETVFRSDTERTKEFAGSIVDGNIVETLRIALLPINEAMANHIDDKNDDRNPDYMPVIGLVRFMVIDGVWHRVVVICYSRMSIQHTIDRRAMHGPAIQDMVKHYFDLPPNRREITSDLIPNKGEAPTRTLPHANKMIFLSSMVDVIWKLHEVLPLNHLGCCAMLFNVISSESPDYMYKVINAAMDHQCTIDLLKKMDPYQIGYYFYDEIFKRKEVDAKGNEKVEGQRHQPSNNRRAQREVVHLSIQNIGLMVSSINSLSSTRRKDLNTFCKASIILCRSPQDKGCHGCGPLTCQHILVAGAMLGIFPNAFMAHAEIAPSTVSFDYICDKYRYDRSSPTIAEDMRQLLDAVSEVIGETAFVAENNGCEKVRSAKGTSRYCDTIYPQQRLIHYLPNEDLLSITSLEGTEKLRSLLKWPKGSKTTLPPCADGYWDVKLERKIPSKRNASRSTPKTLKACRKLYERPTSFAVSVGVRKPFHLHRSCELSLGLTNTSTKLKDCFIVQELSEKEKFEHGVRYCVGISGSHLPQGVLKSKKWFPSVKLPLLTTLTGACKRVHSKRFFFRLDDARRHCMLAATLYLNHDFTVGRFFPYFFREKNRNHGGRKRKRPVAKTKAASTNPTAKRKSTQDTGTIQCKGFICLFDASANRGKGVVPTALVLDFKDDYVFAFVDKEGNLLEDHEYAYVEKVSNA